MTPDTLEALSTRALRVREHIVRMCADGGCFVGASLSCADLIVYLYSLFLNVSPDTAAVAERDYFFLSKGHDVPALYGTLAELGFIDPARLAHHLKVHDSLYWHPNRSVRGVEFHSGSLGHLLAVGIGVALDIRLAGGLNRVVVVAGDGELNEGSMWEAALVAAAQHLDNLTLVIDRNEFQANERTEMLVPLEPLSEKFEAFGWAARRIDGHDFEAMECTFGALPFARGKPSVVIADTVRGKGIASLERRADRWFMSLTKAEVAELLDELHSGIAATVITEIRMVR